MRLSIIIPSFNTKDLLKNCLQSIYSQSRHLDFEVIVVDNHSTDETTVMIESDFPQVNLIKLPVNSGFSRANNLGVQRAKGDWLLFLNSDTQIIDSALEKCLDWIGRQAKDPRSLIMGCQLLNADYSLQPSAGYFPNLGRIFAQMFFIDDLPFFKILFSPYQQDRQGFYKKIRKVDWVTGAFLLVNNRLFQEIKGFDEEIFMYGEEVDFCYRAKQAGAGVFFWPGSQVIHFKGASSKDGFSAAVVGEYLGLISFFKRHKPSWQLPFIKVLLVAGGLLRLAVFGMINRPKAKAYLTTINKVAKR